MDTDPPVLSRRGETITLDADCVDDVHRHCAFSLWDDADEMPDGIDPTTQRIASGAPVPVRRNDLDDVARAETEALVSLAGALDGVCLDVLASMTEVETVAPGDLAGWLVAATESVNDAAAPVCSVNAYLDARLRRHAGLVPRPASGRRTVVDAGWCEADVRLMSRSPETLQVVIADEHLVGLRGYLSVSLTSVDFGAEEFLTASAVFGYSPRIALHPGEIRLARITLPA